MAQKKQTARKTTGKHFLLSSALSSAPPPPPPPSKKRAPRRPTATNGTTSARSQPAPPKSILKRPSAAAEPSSPGRPSTIGWPGPSAPASLLSATSRASNLNHDTVGELRLAVPHVAGGGRDSAQGPLVAWRRPAVHVLDEPVSVCMRFATWLESDKCVHDDALLRAVERDGRPFLSLAKASIMFDNALRGQISPTVNGAAGPLGEHARTLRVFAELLKSKIIEGSLGRELEVAVLRDGEPLLRLALCCLEFDQAIRGPDSTTGS